MDEILKRLCSHRAFIAFLIRTHVPEWADRLDFATLREGLTELISPKNKVLRADCLWIASAKNEDVDFILHLEFQGRSDPEMAARVVAYAASAVERYRRDLRSRNQAHRMIEVESIVLHHGSGRWPAARKMSELARGGGLRRYRLIDRWPHGGRGLDPSAVVPLLLALSCRRGPEQLKGLGEEMNRAIGEVDDEEIHEILATAIEDVLEYRKLPKNPFTGGASMTRAQAVVREFLDTWDTVYQAGSDDGRERGLHEGREQGLHEGLERGRHEGNARLLLRMAETKFGGETSQRLRTMLPRPWDDATVNALSTAVLECTSADDLLARVTPTRGNG